MPKIHLYFQDWPNKLGQFQAKLDQLRLAEKRERIQTALKQAISPPISQDIQKIAPSPSNSPNIQISAKNTYKQAICPSKKWDIHKAAQELRSTHNFLFQTQDISNTEEKEEI